MYQACIFDLDGTLANTLGSIAEFSNRALHDCGYPEIPVDRYRHIVGNGAAVQVQRMMHIVCPQGFTEAEMQKVRRLYDQYYAAEPLKGIVGYPGMPQLLASLRRLNKKSGVLSNKPDSWAQSIIAGLFPDGTFNAVHGQREGIPCKPAPQGALLLAQELGTAPRNCLYIGDTNTDMQTGAAAGMDTVGVLWGFRDRAELGNAHANYIVSDPAQILDILRRGLPASA
ncbi:HAD family hydrolase [Caproicibacterium lactatifermentans]|uniref:HAD-IA family hydrolase n=1 Tax=Caproicibacterium lactatifermentans TaxID=2666138 RepID=A0A859DNQ1_9FIRM|nr:HAD family hydrolase [Caproicibacterium lactatifermentans]QKN23179.1 HAD-IA family hydrolase [Caproicibacterium lactatifermentans]